MPPKQITQYGLRWNHQQRVGRIGLKLADGTTRDIPINDPAEFAALAAILNQAPVFLFPNNEIGTNWEPVDGN